MLATEPGLVDRDWMAEARGPDPDRPRSRRSGKGVFRWQALNARARGGVIGAGAAATAEKGERLLEAQSAAVAAALGNVALWTTPASDHWTT